MTDDKWTVDDLLDLAGVAAADRDMARRRLKDALVSRGAPAVSGTPLAHTLSRVINPDLVPADDDEHLDELAEKARNLLGRLRALRGRPYQHLAFWENAAFGQPKPEHYMRPLDATLPIETTTGLERGNVVQALRSIIDAAKGAKANRSANRRKMRHKEHVVESAALFWLCYSPHEISGTATGKFYVFAEAFYIAATGATGKERNVERAVKEVAQRVKSGEIW